MSYLRKSLVAFLALCALIAGTIYFRHQVYFSKGSNLEGGMFVLEKGEKSWDVAAKLVRKGFISQRIYFLYYLWQDGKLHELKAGNYLLPAGSTIPEITAIITETSQGSLQTKITFPEGWSAKEMAARLSENGLPGNDFLALAQNPPVEIRNNFDFLSELPSGATLEGYLFPDTYFFAQNASAQNILEKMLKNFGSKFSPEIRQTANERKISFYQAVILASIIQKEVRSQEDMNLVGGIFWNRLNNNQRLQSCATLAYILGENKRQYSLKDTQIDSPFNTYRIKGLPPAPIANPGQEAVLAALHPQNTAYNFFLSDPDTGQTIFSKTLEEHNKNKAKYGL